jgi:tol-pal system protein YbgF
MRVLNSIVATATLAVAAGVLSGCATTDGNMSNSVYETHRIVRNLEQDIGPNVSKLNETAAELVARVEATDQENRALRATIQENQAKIDRLQTQISDLTRVIYRQYGLSQPSSGSSATIVPPRPAEVVPPSSGAATTSPPSYQQTPPPMEEGGSMMNEQFTTAPPTAPAPPTATPPTEVTQPPGQTPIEQAVEANTQTAPVSGDAAEVDYISAQKAFIDEDYDTALTRYTEYLTRYPDGQSAHNAQFWKAESYRRLGQNEDAIREFEYLEQRYSDVSDNNKLPLAMMKRAEAHIALGQTARATEILRSLIEQYPMTGVVDGAKARLRSLEGE